MSEQEAHTKLTSLVSRNRSQFDQTLKIYISASSDTTISTPNKNKIPDFLNQLYTSGKLDYAIIDILFTRKILPQWPGTNLVHLNLLLPMCYILLRWDYLSKDDPLTVTFNGQAYNVREYVQDDDLPSLITLPELTPIEREQLILRSVNSALRCPQPIEWQNIHQDYRLWHVLLKMWFHTRRTNSNLSRATILAMAVSFLKHALLDTYDEIKGNYPIEHFQTMIYLNNSIIEFFVISIKIFLLSRMIVLT